MDSTVNRVSGSPAVSAAAGVETAIAAAPATARPATAAAARTVQSSTGEPDRPRAAEKAAQIFGARELSANTLKVSEGDVMAILESGELVGKKIGSTWRIKRSALDEYLAK